MTGHILDCCTLLNLYCGWGGLQNLNAMGGRFHVGATVASEATFVRDYGDAGELIRRELDFTELLRQSRLTVLKLATRQELALMVRLAASMDDGEAEGLAMAACRGLCFCTDDGAVYKFVAAERIRVRLISTPEILQDWASSVPGHQELLPTVVRRATELARFRPDRSSLYRAWWNNLLSA